MDNQKLKMDDYLKVDKDKIETIMKIKLDYLKGLKNMSESKSDLRSAFSQVTAQEFALCEQGLQEHGINDDVLSERMTDILELFEGLLVSEKKSLVEGHPIKTYMDEVVAIRKLLSEMEVKRHLKFIKNQWAEMYDHLQQINIHFSRKQNQLYPALERKGFDKPSKVMWTLENKIREKIKEAKGLLDANEDEAFMSVQEEVILLIEDMMEKEMEILYPTALDLISEETFIQMRKSDDEIGYCLIDTPKAYKSLNPVTPPSSKNDLLGDLAALMQKHGIQSGGLPINQGEHVLDVSQGKLTLDQINLIFKHLQVDLSYVDENEIVKFYSDTKHRVFPRSAGVIGRLVQNCHPRESVHMVEEIIRAFKAGEQEQAEFWLEMGDKFIYIIYNAVRDDLGNFKGVLEMMQDVTHIRSLKGSQRLLSWGMVENNIQEGDLINESKVEALENKASEANSALYFEITKDTLVGDLVKRYPYVKDFLISLSPKFNKLNNPILFKTMSSVATIEKICQRGELEFSEVIAQIEALIQSKQQTFENNNQF